MDKTEGRKIIFECVTGSKLYGTNNENSDDDFTGIFLPSKHDVLSLQNAPTEWTMNEHITDGPRNGAGDVDRKYYSLPRWLKMVAEGQSWAVEMLFAPEDKITVTSPEMDIVREHAKYLISKKSVSGVIGFALAQSNKASIKGENLNYIRSLIITLDTFMGNGYKNLEDGTKLRLEDVLVPGAGNTYTLKGLGGLSWGTPATVVTGKDGTKMMDVVGRKFNMGRDIKTIVKQLKEMKSSYGTRSETAAASGTDWKSLYHAYRLMPQAIEMLLTGKITLPRPPEEVDFLMKIRREEYDADYREELQEYIRKIDTVYKPESTLPEKPDWGKINTLCIELMGTHLFGDKS